MNLQGCQCRSHALKMFLQWQSGKLKMSHTSHVPMICATSNHTLELNQVLVLMDFYFPEAPLPLKTAVASTATQLHLVYTHMTCTTFIKKNWCVLRLLPAGGCS